MMTHIRHLIIRYGVFVLLVMMITGILFFVCNFELRNKTSIHLFYDCRERCWHGYIAEQKNVAFQGKDTLSVIQTSIGDILYIVERIEVEPGMVHLILRRVEPAQLPNTYYDGFVYLGKEKIK